jgi:predicted dehydrogenase
MTPIGVGIVGAGVVGEMRAQTVARDPATRLRGVADVDPARASQVAGQSGGAAVADYRRLLDDPAVDILIVSSPVHLHEEMVVAAVGSGKDVLVEKPLANSVDACRRILDAAATARRTLAVGFNHRYYPCFRRLKAIVDEGTLGPVDHVRAFGGHEGMTQFRAPWMYARATLGGGAMMDVGIHVADLVRHLGFEPATIGASSRTRSGASRALRTTRCWSPAPPRASPSRIRRRGRSGRAIGSGSKSTAGRGWRSLTTRRSSTWWCAATRMDAGPGRGCSTRART